MLRLAFERIATRRLAQIVTPAPRMRVEKQETFLLTLKATHELDQQCVFKHVCKISGMKMMSVIHYKRVATDKMDRALTPPAL